jgi:hypothetical protein
MNPNIETEVQAHVETTTSPSSLMRHLSDLSQEAAALVRGEVALAKAELEEKIDKAKRGVVETAAGGAVLYAGFLTLLAAAVFGLAEAMPLWTAALIVGLAVTIIGAIAVGKGKEDLSAKELKPRRVIAEGRRTTEFAKEQMP